MSLKVSYTSGSFTLSDGTTVKTVDKTNKDYNQLIEKYRAADFDGLAQYLAGDKNLIERNYKKDGFTVEDGVVFVNGEPLPSVLSQRVKNEAEQGLSVSRLLKFWNNIKQNPSFHCVQATYDFLEKNSCPLNEDGYFLAYKTVQSDFLDKYTGRIDNSPGQIVTQNRRTVDDDKLKSCSFGLHIGGFLYLNSYGNESAGDRVVEVLVNPADVVSVPSDAQANKLRVCCYKVIREIPWSSVQNTSEHYSPDGDQKRILMMI